MPTDLEQALSVVKEAFADFPKPKVLDGCPCCVDEGGCVELLQSEDRGMDSPYLQKFAKKAMTTMGTAEEYMYFLPSILHGQAFGSDFYVDIQITGGKIARTGDEGWSPERSSAVEQYFVALMYAVASEETYRYQLDEVMCAFALTGLDVEQYLDNLLRWPVAVVHFALGHERVLKSLGRLSGWWKDCEGQSAVVDWIRSTSVQELVSRFKEDPDLFYEQYEVEK